mgnify:CR=1 FL=1
MWRSIPSNKEKLNVARRLIYATPEGHARLYGNTKRYMNSTRGQYKSKYYQQAHKSRKSSVPSTLTVEEWDEILSVFGYRCAYCDTKAKFEQDHFVPLSSGGGYTKENIVPACRTCNRRKKARDPRAFINDEDRYEAILTLMSV